jgi:hypothetical protein
LDVFRSGVFPFAGRAAGLAFLAGAAGFDFTGAAGLDFTRAAGRSDAGLGSAAGFRAGSGAGLDRWTIVKRVWSPMV